MCLWRNDVDIKRLAEGSVGLTGADIRNLVNEAALWATRQDKKAVSMDDFEYARDKILMGAKREEVLIGEEKDKTAYHEAGHALLAWLTHGADRVHKVTRDSSWTRTRCYADASRRRQDEHHRERVARSFGVHAGRTGCRKTHLPRAQRWCGKTIWNVPPELLAKWLLNGE